MRVRGGARTQNVIMHGVLSPPLRDAPPHGITPSRYSEVCCKLQEEVKHLVKWGNNQAKEKSEMPVVIGRWYIAPASTQKFSR